MATLGLSPRNALCKLVAKQTSRVNGPICRSCSIRIRRLACSRFNQQHTPPIPSIRFISSSTARSNDQQQAEPKTTTKSTTDTEIETTTDPESTSVSNAPDNPEPEALHERFRLIMRRLPHPVVILTTRHHPSNSDAAEPPPYYQQCCAMTLSSFTSVAMKPKPIVSFNMKLPSKTYDALKSNDGHFLIHFLHANGGIAKVASAFTKGQSPVPQLLLPDSETHRSSTSPDTWAISHGPLHSTTVKPDEYAQGAPVLLNDGVYSYIRCKLIPDKEIHVEDHVLLCAEVLDATSEESWKTDHQKLSRNRLGMVYVNGTFRSIYSKPLLDPETTEQPIYRKTRVD